jgi:hypothetical protein
LLELQEKIAAMQKLAINFFIINKNNYKRAYLTGFFGSYLPGELTS